MRRAHGLVELLVAIVLFVVMIAALMLGRVGPGWSVFDPLRGGAPETGALEQQLRKMTAEVQEATRVFYPFAGQGAREGLGIVTADGEAVLYYLEPGREPGSPSTLVRANLTAARTGGESAPAPFLGDVRTLAIAVAPATPGKRPSLVDIGVAVELPDRAGKGVRRVEFVTSAFLRNLERTVPDDLVPPGSPLVDPEP